jgi:phosphatidate cytidylyltransferase
MLTVLFAGCIIPYFLSVMVNLKMLENGRLYVLLPVLVTMISDSGAYFCGVYLGKRKAFPHVSPNKTVEGCVGGLLSSVVGLLLYGLILTWCGVPVSFTAILIIAVLGNIATQLGDLAFSLVKRFYGVKDYGKLVPGHGGMLDRFDSLIFAAPAVYLLVLIFPAF